MNLNIRKLLREGEIPVSGDMVWDFSKEDFGYFQTTRPVRFRFTATPDNGLVRLEIQLQTEISAECARCLAPLVQQVDAHKEYETRESDLDDEFPELPFTPEGLDLKELAYGELLLQVEPVLLCSEDCPGLCPCCGKTKGNCECEAEQQGDPRLQVLRQLLNNED